MTDTPRRRPGIGAIISRLKAAHPDWSFLRVAVEANAEWSRTNLPPAPRHDAAKDLEFQLRLEFGAACRLKRHPVHAFAVLVYAPEKHHAAVREFARLRWPVGLHVDLTADVREFTR